MIQFIAGFILCLGVVFLAVLILRNRQTRKINTANRQRAGQLKLEKEDLIGQLAHEIKNPLSTIKINLTLIGEQLERLKELEQSGSRASSRLDSQSVTRTLRKISVIKREADRLEQILDGFLRYTDKVELQPESSDLNELISDLIDFYTPQAYSRSIIFRQMLHKEPLICKVDSNMLKQALLNLFINAQQSMENGGELIIRTQKTPKYAVIQVTDTGTGIQPDKLSMIFDVYYSSRPRGRGLGLPIAKRIIEAHNGTISVESEAQKGTSFTIKLPLQNPADV